MNEQVLDLGPIRTSGRSRSRITLEPVRPLTREDLSALQEPRASRAPALKRFRDSHHRVARCFASGMKPQEVNLQTGYSLSRLSILQADPAFQDLIAVYREAGAEEYAEYSDLAIGNMVRAERLIEESLEAVAEREQPLTLGELRPLTELISDRADRFGYPKKAVTANINLDFAGRLETARKRSGLLGVATPGAHVESPVKTAPAREAVRAVGEDAEPPLHTTTAHLHGSDGTHTQPLAGPGTGAQNSPVKPVSLIGPVGLAGPKEAVS